MERQSKKQGRSRDDSTKEENLERSRRENMPAKGLLTKTSGSPRVPTPAEMAASPNADGEDNRIGLNQGKKGSASSSKKRKDGQAKN